jgi:hypothetical protein
VAVNYAFANYDIRFTFVGHFQPLKITIRTRRERCETGAGRLGLFFAAVRWVIVEMENCTRKN